MGADGYESFYRAFDSPLMRQMRTEAYGEDIGQHSWVTADELREDITSLALSSSSRFIDLGCGPGGPLTFVLATVGCRGTGVDASASALRVAQDRAAALGVESLLAVRHADLDMPLPFETASFDAATALDVVLHLRDRAAFYREVARILRPGGRFLCTDAGVVMGAMSGDEFRRRSPYGYTTFVPTGLNESLLGAAGFTVLATANRTASALGNATGRIRAIESHRSELEATSTRAAVAATEDYLSSVVELASRKALGRVMYLAEVVIASDSEGPG